METVKGLNKWANAHTYYWLDLLRVLLGVFLCWKGISFITTPEYYQQLVDPIQNIGGGMIIIHYVTATHIMGGIMIAFGLLTRWAIIAQVPILIGAFLVNFVGAMHIGNLLLSSLLLGLCVFFLFYGSGKHSADYYFKMQQ